MRKKDPKYKKQDLINMIVDMTLNGIPQEEIKQTIMSCGYGPSYYYEVSREAKPLIKEALVNMIENKFEETIVEMEKQYNLALQEKDRKLALDIRKEINKISGLHQATTITNVSIEIPLFPDIK